LDRWITDQSSAKTCSRSLSSGRRETTARNAKTRHY
ncbi:hypothetical protein T03_9103, partial [Trichinella britovi]